MHLFQPAQLLVRFALDLGRHLGLFDLLFDLAEFLGAFVAFAKLLLNLFELLAQEVVALSLAHLFFGLVLNARLHGRQLELASEQFVDFFQPLDWIEDFENRLALLDLEPQIRRDQIGQHAGIADVIGHHDDFRRQVLEIQNLLDLLFGRAHQRFDFDRYFRQASAR